MIAHTDKRALTQWTKSEISYKNYQEYIIKKTQKFELTLIDLLYISNFKGGNATINEHEQSINKKLEAYSKGLLDISSEFSGNSIATLTNDQLESLIQKTLDICKLTQKDSETKIDGFSVSYLSALINSYFPTLIPILDRRVLISLGLVEGIDIDKFGQIKNIQRFYRPLIIKFAKLSRSENLCVREIDKILFTKKLIKSID